VQKAVQVLATARKPLVDDKARQNLFGASQYEKR
jgi:GST-like protein